MKTLSDIRVLSALGLAILLVCSCGLMIFKNNENLAIVTAQFIDSGSLLQNYRDMVLSQDFDQSKYYHTAIYGWPGNHIIVWLMWFFQVADITTQAMLARAASFACSVGALVALGYLFAINKTSKLISVASLFFIVTWAPFTTFSYQIHPEAFGLLFGSVSLVFCSLFHQTHRDRWLHASWALAVLAFLAKQPFLIYLIPPLFVGIRVASRHLNPAIYFWRTAAIFIFVGLAVTFISNPYIFLDFPRFLEKQVDIHTHHLSISNSIATAATRWTSIIVFKDSWFLVSLVLSPVAIRRSSNEVVVAAAWANLAFLAVLVTMLKFFFIHSYIYPAIPTSALVIASAPSYLRFFTKRGVITLVVALSAIASVYNGLRSLAVILTDANFTNTEPVRLMSGLYNSDLKFVNVVYSTNLPLDQDKFEKAYNNFQFPADDIHAAMLSIKPDLIIVDQNWPFSEKEAFEQAAKALNMEKIIVNWPNTDPILCDYQYEVTFENCMARFVSQHSTETAHTYYFYLSRSQPHLLATANQLAGLAKTPFK